MTSPTRTFLGFWRPYNTARGVSCVSPRMAWLNTYKSLREIWDTLLSPNSLHVRKKKGGQKSQSSIPILIINGDNGILLWLCAHPVSLRRLILSRHLASDREHSRKTLSWQRNRRQIRRVSAARGGGWGRRRRSLNKPRASHLRLHKSVSASRPNLFLFVRFRGANNAGLSHPSMADLRLYILTKC